MRKFALITHERSGSQMLWDAAAQHPHVQVFKYFDTLGNLAVIADKPLQRQRHQRWLDFLAATPPDKTHLCTCMHAIASRRLPEYSPVGKRLWQEFARLHDRCVLLRRDNILRQYLSRLIAKRDDRYAVAKPRDRNPKPVGISVGELQRYSASRRVIDDQVRAACEPQLLVLTYEAVAANWDNAMADLQRWVGLDVQPIQLRTHKQETRPLRDCITNYDAVANWCKTHSHEDWLNE